LSDDVFYFYVLMVFSFFKYWINPFGKIWRDMMKFKHRCWISFWSWRRHFAKTNSFYV